MSAGKWWGRVVGRLALLLVLATGLPGAAPDRALARVGTSEITIFPTSVSARAGGTTAVAASWASVDQPACFAFALSVTQPITATFTPDCGLNFTADMAIGVGGATTPGDYAVEVLATVGGEAIDT